MTMTRFRSEPQLAIDFSRGRRNSVSKQAHCKLIPRKSSMQEKVFALIEMAGERGLTLYELSEALLQPPHCLSGRLSELSFAGRIVSGETRPNRLGNECTIWKMAGL